MGEVIKFPVAYRTNDQLTKLERRALKYIRSAEAKGRGVPASHEIARHCLGVQRHTLSVIMGERLLFQLRMKGYLPWPEGAQDE